MKKGKSTGMYAKLIVSHWRSEIQHCLQENKVVMASNFILTGTPATGVEVRTCYIDFYLPERSPMQPIFESDNKAIRLRFPYDHYNTMLNYLKTVNHLEVVYDERSEKEIYCFLVNNDMPIGKKKVGKK